MTQYNDKSQKLIDESSTESSVYKEKVDQAQQKASEVTEEAKHQASVLTEQAKAEAKSSLQSQKEMAVQELHGVAQALR
jgi:F0F1-type ATP synthase membrane subunit b/b'